MSKVQCVDLENNPTEINPDIDLDKTTEIFRSVVEKGQIYIRFVENGINVYWVFDSFEEQKYNYKKVTELMK